MIDRDRLGRALATAREHLLAARTADGHWEGELSSSALSTATAVSALAIAGDDRDAELVRQGVTWLAANQNADGGWGDTTDSPSNLSTALLALSALRLGGQEESSTSARDSEREASDPQTQDSGWILRAVATRPPLVFSPSGSSRSAASAAQDPIRRAEAYVTGFAGADPAARAEAVKARYGADRTFAVPILINCALAGLVSWSDIPGLPFELAALPQSWYRAVRLQVVSYALPALIAVGALLHRRNPSRNPLVRGLRGAVLGRVRAKLRTLQPDSGGFLEATPLTAFVAMSLVSAFGPADVTLERCLEFLRASVRADGSWPIDTNLATWVTTSALHALRLSDGLSAEETATVQAWIAAGQYAHVHPYTGARPGGWGWTQLPGAVPDADDTSGAILALAGSGREEAIANGVQWLLQLQNSDGGWPTFCRGWGQLPFDQSCPDITAHALRALQGASGGVEYGRLQDKRGVSDPRTGAAGWILRAVAARPTLVFSPSCPSRVRRAMARGLAYLAREQRPDGSWHPLWFGNQQTTDHANPVLGTARVLMALAELARDEPMARRGVAFLTECQSADGSWGGARGIPSSVEETALAVSALSQWPEACADAVSRGAGYLVGRVEDGSWVQPAPIGLYFASLWYSERLYPVIWTVEALARARKADGGA